MDYRVSILVPVYGVEQYIERCARSLFEQTCQALEYVFVNDCTPDKSMELLSRVLEDYPERKGAVKIVNHEKNRGLAAARNTGVENATGEFVCLVDSDDWLERNAVEVLLAGQQENDADMVSGNRMVHYAERTAMLLENKCESKEDLFLQVLPRSWDHFVTGRLFRRSVFVENKLCWNEGLDKAEDRFMMTLFTYQTKRFEVVDAVIYHYERSNENAMTYNNDRLKELRYNYQELKNMLSLMFFFADKETFFRTVCAQTVSEQLAYTIKRTLRYSDKKEFGRIVAIVDDCSDEVLGLIGWTKSGFKGWRLHNYSYTRIVWIKDRIIRFVKNKLSV